MRIYKSFEEFKKYADDIALRYNFIISKYNEDYSIDVDGNVELSSREYLTEIPIQFNKVTGSFYCSNNNLTSLKGCPESVGEDFWCFNNDLTSLKGCPEYVGGNFDCHNNQLTSLEGCPKYIRRNFVCYHNELTSLKGCPEIIENIFNCCWNELTSLQGAPEIIRGEWVVDNEFESSPEYQKYLLVKKIEAL